MKPNEPLGHQPCCRSLLIVGAGVMGQGIARLFAAAGIDVTLMDCRDVKVSYPGVKFVRETPAAAPDLVIEAVFEDAVVKKSVYAEMERVYGGRPVVATNTSGLPLNDLAGGLKYSERFLAMHFFMPAEVFPMIEGVRANRTEDSAIALAISAVKQAGREPIVLERAINGYLINRLQHSILHEAYHLLEEGIATPEMIDNVAKRLLGHVRDRTAGAKGYCRSRNSRQGAAIDCSIVVAHGRPVSVSSGHGCSGRSRRWNRQGLLRLDGMRRDRSPAPGERTAAAADCFPGRRRRAMKLLPFL
jgi:hypothetical protein